jgi:formamidopyrimidine-DNA glycosylase
MPELAEVEFFRKRWARAAAGTKIRAVHTQDRAQVFRGTDPAALRHALTGAAWRDSEAAAKQMVFRFSGNVWLGIHLGMTGELRAEPRHYRPGKHDHLVLTTNRHQLVFSDPRKFGRVQFSQGPDIPKWWARLAPAILSPEFTVGAVAAFLRRRRRAPIKAVLLQQERFPGIGNWMADEILWRAAIHPRRPAGDLRPAEVRRLWRECRHICRLALNTIAGRGPSLPRDLNVNIPDTWLFHHRWREGGMDPLTGTPLARATIGGRTTCWSPARQKLPGEPRP